ncbi:MAG: hypothetical protein UZ11_BCD004001352 [Bacteroidetes bacterium OLB11]|nr:MAG: hypothetical protein UZ11_BCD004001352 [Bacteroidetes bacterium OLB11]
MLQAYQSVGRVSIHNLQEQAINEIGNENYLKHLSEAEKSMLQVVSKINVCLLNSKKNKAIEYHGII